MSPTALLTAKQVEALTDGGITARRAQQAARLGLFPPGVVVRIGRQVRFSERALMEFLEAGGKGLAYGWAHNPPKPPVKKKTREPEEEQQIAAVGGV
jgi:hypothetical protein